MDLSYWHLAILAVQWLPGKGDVRNSIEVRHGVSAVTHKLMNMQKKDCEVTSLGMWVSLPLYV